MTKRLDNDQEIVQGDTAIHKGVEGSKSYDQTSDQSRMSYDRQNGSLQNGIEQDFDEDLASRREAPQQDWQQSNQQTRTER